MQRWMISTGFLGGKLVRTRDGSREIGGNQVRISLRPDCSKGIEVPSSFS